MSGFGPMFGGGCGGGFGGPYGKGKGFGKGKGKGFGKGGGGSTGPKPLVNPNQITPSKEAMDGGISFKNILQEKVAKLLNRAIMPGDFVYEVTRVAGGRQCTLTCPCLGPEHKYEAPYAGNDDKHAGQLAASVALERVMPDVYIACLEAHKAARETGVSEGATPQNIDPMGEPKGLLNGRLSLTIGRQLAIGDIVYTTAWDNMLHAYLSVLTIPCLGDGTQVYTSLPSDGKDDKSAEKSAARMALEANKIVFDDAAVRGAARKAATEQKNRGYKGLGKGGKGFGGFGKGR